MDVQTACVCSLRAGAEVCRVQGHRGRQCEAAEPDSCSAGHEGHIRGTDEEPSLRWVVLLGPSIAGVGHYATVNGAVQGQLNSKSGKALRCSEGIVFHVFQFCTIGFHVFQFCTVGYHCANFKFQ